MPKGSRLARAGGLAFAACAVLPALNGCGLLGSASTSEAPGPAATTAAAKSYTVTAPVALVVINGGAGKITVTGSTRSTVAVTEQPYYSNSTKPPTSRHTVSGSTLTLSYSCQTQITCGVGYDVQVPRGLTVRVSDREGAITLTGLAGPVSAQTIAGVITATRLSSPSASFKSTAGAITVACTAAPATLTATTTAGPITLTVPRSAIYKVNAHTVIGHATVTVRQSASARSVITASSDLGGITIT